MQADNLRLIQINPWTRINERWTISDQKLWEIFDASDPNERFTNFEDHYSTNDADPQLHQQAFLHVVTETVFHYPHDANGEKTWKPIANLRPFVLLSVPGALRNLHAIGFKTFDTWWDESYDQIVDPAKRLLAVTDVIQWVCSRSIDELATLLEQMHPVLLHNHRYYYKHMREQQLMLFDKKCKQNLSAR